MAGRATGSDQASRWIAEVFNPDLISKRDLRIAGWVAYEAALTMVPVMVASTVLAALPPGQVRGIGGLLLLAMYGPFVFVFSHLRRLLNQVWGFHGADTAIKGLIACQTILAVCSLFIPAMPLSQMFSLDAPEPKGIAAAASYAVIVTYVATGVLFIVLGMKLRRLDEGPEDRLKALRRTSIAMGICTALLVLLPVALILAVVQAVQLGRLFHTTAEQPGLFEP